jgi:hypothetical protein
MFGLPGGSFEFVILLAVFALGVAVYIFPMWRICERLGRPGAMSLLYLVPLGEVILLYMLAFGSPTEDVPPPPPPAPLGAGAPSALDQG